MDKRLRDGLRNIANGIGKVLSKSVDSLVSLLRVMVLSRFEVARKANHFPELKTNTNCTILANGPSLKKAFEDGDVKYEENDVFVVNMFVHSPEFWMIKPKFYFLADDAYFAPRTERTQNFVKSLSDAFQRVDWDMFLCIPSTCVNGGILKALNNSHIKIIRWNTTTFEGFRNIRHFMYSHNMAMPRCQTIANMTLIAAINMGYENIFLYGVDHSWTRDLCVNDDNEVCYGDRHVYATSIQIVKKEGTIGRLLHCFAYMFDSHWMINDYAKFRGVNIWNCTRDSFIDAYPRKYK